MAESIKNTDGDKWLGATESEYLPYFKQVGAAAMMDIIRGSCVKLVSNLMCSHLKKAWLMRARFLAQSNL